MITGHVHHPDKETLRGYDERCYEAIVDHWAAKILAQPTDGAMKAQVEATPKLIQRAVRERARELYRQRREQNDG